MRIISWVLGLVVLSIYSCQERGKEEVSPGPKEKLAIDSSATVFLDTDKEMGSIFCYFSKSGNDFFAGEAGDSINLFLMNTGKLLSSIPIPQLILKDSTDETSLKSICMNDTNDVFFITRKKIFRSRDGVVTTHTINENAEEYLLYNLQNDHPVFDETSGKLYLQKYSTKFAQHQNEFYATPVLSSINFNTGKEEDIPLRFPDNYLKNYYGFANQVYFSSNSISTVVSFMASSDIFLYNRKTKSIDVINGKSSYQKTEPTPLPTSAIDSRREKMQHWYSIPEYHETLIDANDKFIYRFYLNAQELKRTDGTYNSYWDKQFVLMVFSGKELAGEYDLSKRGYDLYFSFPGTDRLYMRQNSADGKAMFRIFKFH